MSLNEAFRQAWQRFLSAGEDTKSYQLSELMNLIELACAIHLENSLFGASNELIKEYLADVLRLLIKDTYTRTEIPTLLQGPKTFIYIKKFLKAKRDNLSVTIPLEWYERAK